MFKTCNTCEYYNEPQYCRMHDARTLSTWTCPDYLGDEPRCTKCGSVLQEWQPKYGIYFCSYCKTSIQHPEWAKLKHDIDSKVHAQRLLDTNFGASADELLGKYKIDKEGNMKKEAIPKVWTDSNKATYWFEQHNEAQERIEDLEKLIKRHQAAFNDMKRKNEELQYKNNELREEIKRTEEYYLDRQPERKLKLIRDILEEFEEVEE